MADMAPNRIQDLERRDITRTVEFQYMQESVREIHADMVAIKENLESINSLISEARGGWKALLRIVGVLAGLGAIITWVLEYRK